MESNRDQNTGVTVDVESNGQMHITTDRGTELFLTPKEATALRIALSRLDDDGETNDPWTDFGEQ